MSLLPPPHFVQISAICCWVKVLLDLDFGLNPKFHHWFNCRKRTNRETSTWEKLLKKDFQCGTTLTMQRCSLGGFLEIRRLLGPGTKIFFNMKEKWRRRSRKTDGRCRRDRKIQWYSSKQLLSICERFGFVSENYMCEKCDDGFENEAEVMSHIRSVHDKDVRKMFASDAIEHLEADREYRMWLNAITIQGVFFNCITFSLHFFRIGVRTSLGLC